jgi:predicted transcriptional regulator
MRPLPRREQQVLDTLLALGEGGAEQIRAAMTDPPSNSAIRAMLVRIEAKGFIRHRVEDQRYVYMPVITRHKARQDALRHVVRTFFDGSAAGAATTLLGMTDRLEEAELRRLEELIKAARGRVR